MEDYIIEHASSGDIKELLALYDAWASLPGKPIAPCGWIRGVYPVEKDIEKAIAAGTMYILRDGGKIAASMVLNHDQAEAYKEAAWSCYAFYDEVLVVHMLAVSPEQKRKGVAARMMEHAELVGKSRGCKVVRLDTSIRNYPAIRLYEKCGYRYAGEVDLRLGIEGLRWFKCFEKKL